MPEKLRCGVIGAGAIGLDHLASLSSCTRAATVAIADSSPSRAREACDRFKIPRCYTDYRELLEQPDVEAVIIAVPNYLHAPIAIAALEARKHVLLEKPFALNLKEAAKIARTAERMKMTLMVAQSFRFHPHAQMVKALIQKGEGGEIYHVRSFWMRNAGIPRIGSWFTRREFSGGGCMLDLGVHCIDLALHFLNSFDVISVSGATHSHFGCHGRGEGTWGRSEIDPKKTCDVEDQASAFLKLRNGQTVSVDVAWAAFQPAVGREFGVDIFGTEAGFSIFPAQMFRTGPNGQESTLLNLSKLPAAEDRVHHFVQCALFGKKPLVTLQESLRVQEILDAIYTSAASKKEVRL